MMTSLLFHIYLIRILNICTIRVYAPSFSYLTYTCINIPLYTYTHMYRPEAREHPMRRGARGPEDRRLWPEQDDPAQGEDGQRMRHTVICRS